MKETIVEDSNVKNSGKPFFTTSYTLNKIKKNEFTNVLNPKKVLIKFQKPSECKLLNEYKEKYTYDFIFNSFLEKKPFNDLFLPLIDKFQYKRALDEYVKYGKIMHFPEDKIYQWLGIILKNSLLIINSSIMHYRFSYIPTKFVNETLLPYFFNGKEFSTIDEHTFSYSLPEEVYSDGMNKTINEILTNRVVRNAIFGDILVQNFGKEEKDSCLLSNCLPYFYTSLSSNIEENFPFFYAEKKDGKTFIKATLPYVNETIGFYTWCGMDKYTEQMGLTQIIMLLNELKDDMSPEEILVWINRMLDIYHFRADLSKAFINGGKTALDEISTDYFHH